MNKQFLGRIHKLGLGFARRENGAREKRKKEKRSERMGESGPFFLLCSTRTGSVQNRPIFLHPWPLDLGLVNPDQSNALKAFWRSGSTSVWVGPVSIGLLFFFLPVSWIFLLYTPLFLLFEPLCMLKFLAKS